MAVKSVVDIEINDEAFRDFAKIFEKYRIALGDTPKQWAAAGAAAAGTAVTVEALVAGLLTHEAINKKIAREEAAKQHSLEAQARASERVQRAARGMSVPFRDVDKSFTNIGLSIAKWATYGGVAGGLLGFGGLLGLDRLALLTGSGRREAQGLGTTYGENKAFQNSYDRIVDSRSLLGGVNEALTDVTKRSAFYGAGLSNSDLASGDSATVGLKVLDAVKKLVDKTPTALLGNLAQSRQLGQFGFDAESLRRLKATSPEELASIRAGYGTKAQQFNLDDKVARKWQDLGVALDASKTKIESVLVDGLQGLAGPLAKLSDHVANALSSFIKGLDPKTIDGIGQGIEDFGKYLGSPQFRTDVKTFALDVSYAATKIAAALKFLGLIPDATTDQNARAKSNAQLNALDGGNRPVNYSYNSVNRPGGAADLIGDLLHPGRKTVLGENARWTASPNDTNPGNIRFPGQATGFAKFIDGPDAGIRAIAKQIGLYEKRDHLDTLLKIAGRYAPKGDGNNVEAYAKDLAGYVGVGANAKLDPNDQNQIAKIVAGITKHEGRKRYTTEQTKIIIQNNTGGSAVVQSSQTAKQG